jgi:hypothetical protein
LPGTVKGADITFDFDAYGGTIGPLAHPNFACILCVAPHPKESRLCQ